MYSSNQCLVKIVIEQEILRLDYTRFIALLSVTILSHNSFVSSYCNRECLS